MTSALRLRRAARVAGFAAIAAASSLSTARVAAAQRLDRSKRPSAPPPARVTFPAVHSEKLDNGLVVRVVENHALPLVAVRVAVEGGALLDPDGKEGLFTLDTLLLRDGTTSMTGEQLAEAIDELGAPISPTRVTTVTQELERSLDIIGDMLMHPVFPEDAIGRRRAAIESAMQRAEGLSSTPALRIFNVLIFGATHPYARTPSATSLASITRDDLVRFHDRYIQPQNVTLTIVGDVTPASASTLVKRVFETWKKTGDRVTISVPAAPAPEPTTIYLYDRPGSKQSTVVMGQAGPPQTTPDFFALETVGALFGGPTGSRLTQALREGHALTYSVAHLPMWRRANDPSSIFGSSNIDPTKTDTAIKVWLGELTALVGTRPPVDSELTFARSVTARALATRIETLDEIANRLNLVALNDYPPTYYNDYIAGIDHVSLNELEPAARRHIDPAHTVIVVVGDRKLIEPGIRAANIAPVVIVDEKGSPIQQ